MTRLGMRLSLANSVLPLQSKPVRQLWARQFGVEGYTALPFRHVASKRP